MDWFFVECPVQIHISTGSCRDEAELLFVHFNQVFAHISFQNTPSDLKSSNFWHRFFFSKDWKRKSSNKMTLSAFGGAHFAILMRKSTKSKRNGKNNFPINIYGYLKVTSELADEILRNIRHPPSHIMHFIRDFDNTVFAENRFIRFTSEEAAVVSLKIPGDI